MKRLFLLCSVLIAVGCQRAATTTTIASDGSFDRKIKLTLTKGLDPRELNQVFQVPEADSSVTVSATKNDKESVTTSARHVPQATSLPPDIVVLDKHGKPAAQSQVVVTKLIDGDVRYEETIHWLAAPIKLNDKNLDEMKSKLTAFLPPRFRSKENVSAIATRFVEYFLHTAFGPPHPRIFEMLVNPDAAEIRTADEVSAMFDSELGSMLPGLTAEEKSEMLKQINAFRDSETTSASANSQSSKTKDADSDAELTSLFFVVKPPGKVIETNGIVGPDGRVSWCLYLISLATGDIKLTLTAHPN